jgi:hypothetical protein
MNLTLTIEASSFDEIAHLFGNRANAPSPGATAIKEIEPSDPPVEETPEQEAPPAKKTRTRRESAKQDTAASSPPASTQESGAAPSASGPTATNDASPSDEPVTFEDIRTAASALMDSGKVDGRALQEMLLSKFDARAFTALKPEQYADCLAELQNLG